MTDSGAQASTPAGDEPEREAAVSDWTTSSLAARLFATTWAMAYLFHHRFGPPRVKGHIDSLEVFVAVACLLLIAMPGSHRLLLLAAGAQVLAFVLQSPVASNHHTVVAFCNAALIVSLLARWRKPDVLASAYALFRPAALASLVVLYFWGVFHKLNAGFFDLDVSCGAVLMRALESHVGIAPSHFSAGLAIASTFVIEGGAMLLLFTRFWPLAVLGAVPFHYIIGFTGHAYYVDFSATVLALMLTNFDDRQLGSIKPWVSKVMTRLEALPIPLPYLRVAPVLLCYLLVAWSPLPGRFAQQFLIFFVYGALLSVLLVRSALPLLGRSGLGPLRAGLSRYTAPVVVVFWINGMCPYLGYKTEGSIAMYSNLYTEGETNHFLIPTSWQLFALQEPVTVERTDIDELRKAASSRRPITTYELWHAVQKQPEGRVVFVQDGERRTFDGKRGDVPDYEPNWLVRKTARFKRITLERPHPCTH